MQLSDALFDFVQFLRFILFLGGLTVAAEELVNTTSGINELALTSVERVRCA